ncbi:hypothetical protein ACER0A_013805 [Haloimpatiens sp. FM7315]|uniref:hypothetical protein n=1 Tax=Haloimpatiens sp. FM7315 TaxID=3298609 RepID=UPI0035A3ACAA
MSNIGFIRKKNIEFSKSLTNENNKIFTDIVCYLRVSGISEQNQEEIISDILRMFLDCQEKGESVDRVIGNDYKEFADNIISAINPKFSKRNKIKEYIGTFIMGTCLLFTIDLIFDYIPKVMKNGFNLNYKYDIDLSMIITCLFIVVGVSVAFDYIGKNSFTLSKKHFSKTSNFIFGAFLSALVIFFIVIQKLTHGILVLSLNYMYGLAVVVVYWGYEAITFILNKKIELSRK